MTSASKLRSNRVIAEISATLLAAKARVNRCRLSNIERGYVQPTEEELQRLTVALEDLIRAKSVVDRVAASVGWPLGVRHDQ
jgi:transcriptional regulator with XRE-family HTH domain